MEAGIHLQAVNFHLHPDQGCSPRERPSLPRRNSQNLRGTTAQRDKAVDFTDYAHKILNWGAEEKAFERIPRWAIFMENNNFRGD